MTTEDLGPAKTFLQFMEAVLASDLTSSQRLVLIVQAKHADAHNDELTGSFPSEETLAKETDLSTKTIERTRKALVELGWLVQTHSGRGGSSKLANTYDLRIPGSTRHSVALQTDMVSQTNRHSVGTSTPSSTPRSAPASTPSQPGGFDESKEGTKDGPGESYWVGFSKNRPDGYFKRIEARTVEPKGSHVLVTLTGPEVRDAFQAGRPYEDIRAIMLDRARAAGLRPPSSAISDAPSGTLSRAERDKLYGLPSFQVERRLPSFRQPSPEEEDARAMRYMFPSMW